MDLFQRSIYYPEKQREQYFRELFVEGVKEGLNGQVLLALTLFPQLQKERFLIATDKLNENVKKAFYEKNHPKSAFKARQNQEIVYPEETEVNFCYFLLKHNQAELLKKMISSDDDQPFVTPPYQRINLFDENGNEKIHLIFYDDHDGEPFSREQGLEMVKQGFSTDYSNDPYLKLFADALPNYLEPIHQNEVSAQLRFLYYLDGNIEKMSKELFAERDINLVASYPSIIPESKSHKVRLDDVLGLGESMDSDYWAGIMASRKEYEIAHADELARTQGNYQTTVENIWDVGKPKQSGGMK